MRSGSAVGRPQLLLTMGLVVLSLAAGCGLAPSYIPRASDQWSNGQPLGTASLNNPLALQVDAAGNVFVVWVGLEQKLDFARLNERAEIVSQRALDFAPTSPMRPQLLIDPTGQLHLAWLGRQGEEFQLFYGRLSADGHVLQQAIAISPPEQRAMYSWMAIDPVGQTVELFWSDNSSYRLGCHHAALDWSGTVVVPPETLIPDGWYPSAQVDRQGFVHLAWRVEGEGVNPEYHYAVYDPQRRMFGPDVVVGEPKALASLAGSPVSDAEYFGPLLGLDENVAYVAWMVDVNRLGYGPKGLASVFSYYTAFPQPALSRDDGTAEFDYPLPEAIGEAVLVQGADTTATGHPRFLSGHPEQQVMTCYTEVSGPGNLEMLQIAVVGVEADRIQEQEYVNMSRAASMQPNVALDGQGGLHLAWIETAGFNRYQVVYASNSPQVKDALNRVTVYEIVDKALSMVMHVLSALFFIPLVLSWMLAPMTWLVTFYVITHEARVSTLRGRSALGLAILLQPAVKLFFLTDLLTRFEFSFRLSPSLNVLVGRWIVPVLVAILSAGLAWVYVKRRRSQSIFAAYFVYAAVDSLLTLIIYVALPMGGI